MADVRNVEKGDLITGLVFLAMGLLAVGEGLRLTVNPLTSGLHHTLGPGYYVLILGIVLIASSVAYIATLYMRRPAATTGSDEPAVAAEGSLGVSKVIITMTILAGYAILTPRLGYVPATFVFGVAAFRFFGVRNWIASVASAAVLTAAFYLVFIHYLRLVLPRGLLEGFI